MRGQVSKLWSLLDMLLELFIVTLIPGKFGQGGAYINVKSLPSLVTCTRKHIYIWSSGQGRRVGVKSQVGGDSYVWKPHLPPLHFIYITPGIKRPAPWFPHPHIFKSLTPTPVRCKILNDTLHLFLTSEGIQWNIYKLPSQSTFGITIFVSLKEPPPFTRSNSQLPNQKGRT